MLMSEIVLAGTPYADSELAYRRAHGPRLGKVRGAGRRWVRRRPGLTLPQPRRRPLAVA
jgi:hypothetical protein